MPECYLKPFEEEGQFYVLDIQKLRKGYNEFPKGSNASKICYLEDFYRLEFDEYMNNAKAGEDDLFIESKVLTQLEGKYGGLINRLIKDQVLSRKDCVDLCDFIIQLKLRNPYWLKNTIEENKNDWLDKLSGQLYEEKFKLDPRFAGMPDDYKELVYLLAVEERKADAKFSKKMHQFSLIERFATDSKRNEKFRRQIIDCVWQIYKCPPNGPFFITTDNPGVSIGHDNLLYNTKFIGGFIFYLPLSPQYCLTISDALKDHFYSSEQDSKQIFTVDIEGSHVIEVNDRVIQRINKLLIGMDDWYLKQIADNNRPK